MLFVGAVRHPSAPCTGWTLHRRANKGGNASSSFTTIASPSGVHPAVMRQGGLHTSRRSSGLVADAYVPGDRHCGGTGRPAIATGGANAGAHLGQPVSHRRPACCPSTTTGHAGLDLAAPAHLRRGRQRADGLSGSSEYAHGPALRPLEAAAAHGSRPGRPWGRPGRVHVHFRGGGGGGTGSLRKHDRANRRPIPSKTARRNDGDHRECIAVAIDDVGGRGNTSFALLIVQNHARPPVGLLGRPRPAAAAAAKMGAVVPSPPSHGLPSPPSTRGRFVRPEARAVSRFFR